MKLQFLADENISRHLVNLLREQGCHVSWIRERKSGISDLEIIETAAKEDLIIITNDKDFGYLIYKQRLKCPGKGLRWISHLVWYPDFLPDQGLHFHY